MTGEFVALNWLAHVALGGSCFLAMGSIAVCCCRQPIRKIRLMEWTLLGALFVPGLAALSVMPRWHFGWLSSEPARSEIPPVSIRPLSVDSGHLATSLSSGVAAQKVTNDAPAPARHQPPESDSVQPTTAPVNARMSTLSIPVLALLVYGGFVMVLLADAVIGIAGLVRLRWTAAPAPADVRQAFETVAGKAGSRVRLLVSNRVKAPLAFQGWTPTILVPQSLCEGATEELRYCLAHEWSHIQRGDLRRWSLATLLQFLYFYQPLFWWLRGQLRLCQDFVADAHAARQCSQREDYAEYLVRMTRSIVAIPAAALGISDHRSNLYRRVTMLLAPREPVRDRCGITWSLATAIAAVAFLTIATGLRLDAGPLREGSDARLEDQSSKQAPSKSRPDDGQAYHYAGKVKDKETGKPIAGAIVTVRRSLYGDPEVKAENQIIQETKHTTNKDGKYEFTVPPEQSGKRYLYIELDVEHPEYAPQKHFGYGFQMILKNEKLGDRAFFESVELWPGKAIRGRVQDPEGNPIPAVKVLAYSRTTKKGKEFEYGSFADTRTDKEGRFSLVVTTPGAAVFWLLPDRYAPSLHGVKDGKRGDLGTFTLSSGPKIRGRVLDAKGKPLSGINVNADLADFSEELQGLMVANSIDRSAVTNERGEFEMRPLPPGHYRVQPADHSRDGSKDDRQRYPVPAVFVPHKVVLKNGEDPASLEIRASPHVVFEAQYVDSHGKPMRGHDCHIFGQVDKQSWLGQSERVDNGTRLIARLPHGLENTQINLMTNEHSVLRWRKGKDQPLQNTRTIQLGTINDDVKIEIVRYTAPIVIVNAKDKDGHRLKDFKVQILYQPGRSNKEKGSSFINGVQGDVYFEKLDDGRWKSQQLFPDEDFTLSVSSDGHEPKSMQMKLPEAEIKEVDFVLDKPARTKEMKEKK
jgi:beta-lactamase regulating signal transducer with metallopeptidase domain/protocatechuate 3,4-dioxygenase beta subunit